ncbi:MAG: hypothetical protein DMF56_00290 [Acidobacteria bacterium]|nr:MAG: hypothetical protein DMF56_00290 [Acidobacteriota bacterium]
MRRLMLLLFIALPLSAGWVFNKSEVVVEVGRVDDTLRAFDGSFGMGNHGTNESLHSADNHIAVAWQLQDGHFEIYGISPGDTVIPRSTGGYYVKIHVVCGSELPVRAERPVIAGRAGEPVQLRVLSEIAQRTTFQWYAGHIGDTSQLLATGGAELTFTPLTSTKQYVWVSAITPCSLSTAEFEIDVPPVRSRAVRH